MMFAAVPPSRMIAVDARRRAELLAPQADRAEQHDHRVERVQAAPRIGRRVRLQAGEHDLVVLGRERVGLDVVAVARVIEQRGVDPGEQAVVDHDLLAAPPLLGRRAEEDDLARELVGDRRERDGGSHPRRGHRVVAAAVSEARQGVVLGEDADARAVAAAAARMDGPDGRREAAGRMLDLEPVVAQDLGDPRRGLVLLERRLRVGVDPMRQLEDLATGRFDGGGDAGLEVELGLGRSNGGQVGHGSSVGRLGVGERCSRRDGSAARRSGPQRSAESVASATAASARMNSAIGNSRAPCRRSTTKIATMRPIHPPRRAARTQSPR